MKQMVVLAKSVSDVYAYYSDLRLGQIDLIYPIKTIIGDHIKHRNLKWDKTETRPIQDRDETKTLNILKVSTDLLNILIHSCQDSKSRLMVCLSRQVKTSKTLESWLTLLDKALDKDPW